MNGVAPAAVPPAATGFARSSARRALLRWAFLLIAAALVVAAAGLTTHGFLSRQNVLAVLTLTAGTGLAAVGMTLITVSGNLFSLSTAGAATVSGMAYALLLNAGDGVVVSLLLALGLALVLGLAQGIAVGIGLNPIITTLGASAALAGLASLMSASKSINIRDADGLWIGQAQVAGIPVQLVVLVVLAVVVTALLRWHRIGRELSLVGSNRATASASGLRPFAMTVIAFAAAGICAGFAGMVQTAHFGQVSSGQFSDLTFDTVAAVLVGGVTLRGGKGSPVGAAIGACLVALIQNALLIHGASVGVQYLAEAALVAIAIVGFGIYRRRTDA